MKIPYYFYPSSKDDTAKVAFYMLLFNMVRTRRVNFEWQWEEAAALCWPEYRNSFAYGRVNTPGAKYTQFQIDSSAAIASWRFGSIMDNLATPSAMLWSKYRPSGKDAKQLWKRRRVREYFDDVTRIIWSLRYRPEANFAGQNFMNWQAMGVFGNMGMFCEEINTTTGHRPGFSYRACPPGEIYVLQSEQGLVDGFIRHFRRTARQARQLCERQDMDFPPVLATAEEQNSQELFNFIQVVHPNSDFRPWAVASSKGKRWTSTYLSVEGYCIMGEGGYYSFPLAYSRYMQAPDEDYGRGAAQMVLPALKSLNAEKRVFMTQAHFAGDPAYLLPDDGTFDFRAHSGAFNYGGMTQDGKKLVDILPTGNIQMTEEAMKMEVAYINDAFLVSLFKITWEDKDQQKSARQIIEESTEKAVFLAPGVGRQLTEYCGPLCHREYDVAERLGLLPPKPDELKEAGTEYDVVFCSPLSRAMQGQEVAGYMQTVEMITSIANSGHPEAWDILSGGFQRAIPAIAERRMVPEDWMATPQEIAQSIQQRAQAQKEEQRVKSLPGEAAIEKAHAITAKAQTGGNIGGTLSGTPEGGMPQVPGNPQGQPGQPPPIPGQPGRPGIPAPAVGP